MGKLFAFFSPCQGIGRVTSLVSSCGSMMSLKNRSVAITEAPYSTDGIEEYFDHHITRSLREGINSHSGLYALNLLFRGGKISKDKIREAAVKTINKNLDIFPAPFGLKGNSPSEDEAGIFMELITNDLRNAYDCTLVDLGSKTDTRVAMDIMKKADAVICLLPQNSRTWKHFFNEGSKAYEMMREGKRAFVINGYLKNSINNAHTLRFRFGEYIKNNRVFTVCSNSGLLDAACDGMTAEYFLSNRHICRKDEEYTFFHNISDITGFLEGEADDGD